jgi:DNA repair exonuclease SbcCD nuclease subunit
MTKFRRQKQSAKKANAILAADLHIRSDTPLCRNFNRDDYLKAQWDKLDFIFKLCKENDCPLLIAGDVGNKSQWPNWLLEVIINIIKVHDIEIIAIPGQHDLPEHRLENWQKSGCGVLHGARAIKMLLEPKALSLPFRIFPFGYGNQIKHQKPINRTPTIAMTHQMVIEDKLLWPDQKAPKGHELLKKFPEYDLILSGDNHNPFVAKYEGRLLVNPGSMMRMTAAQIDHKPRVYKLYADTNEVEAVYLPIEKGIISRTHIKTKQERDERMEAFVSRMSDDIEIGLSFEQNLEEYFNKNRTKKSTQDKVWKAVE